MSAISAWWYCGQCGFRNHPRQHPSYDRQYLETHCEQCGATRDDPDAVDYKPLGG